MFANLKYCLSMIWITWKCAPARTGHRLVLNGSGFAPSRKGANQLQRAIVHHSDFRKTVGGSVHVCEPHIYNKRTNHVLTRVLALL